ncbi:MAG: type II toxin-antitoxin system VapC family toxin [Actinomycetota bacterium]|nr:type II toxin-antitoxin system VapC family toxin [Actinomycetota bacterium]
MIAIDTNVTSELMRPAPDPSVLAWVRAQTAGELCTTSITFAEIRYGIERLPDGRRKEELRSTAEEVFSTFAEDVLTFDAGAAMVYAGIVSNRERSGAPIDGFDAQIASICRTHQATLATGNTKDFEGTGVAVLNPWTHET